MANEVISSLISGLGDRIDIDGDDIFSLGPRFSKWRRNVEYNREVFENHPELGPRFSDWRSSVKYNREDLKNYPKLESYDSFCFVDTIVRLSKFGSEHLGTISMDRDLQRQLELAVALCASVSVNNWGNDLCVDRGSLLGIYVGILGNPVICYLLSNALSTNSTVKSLSLMNAQMNADGLRLLLFGRVQCLSWETVTWKLNEINVPEDFAECDIDEDTSRARNTERLLDKNFQYGGLISRRSHMTALNLYGNPLGDEGIRYLALLLHTDYKLKELDIRYAGFGLPGATDLANALKHNKTLDNLAFSYATPASLNRILNVFSGNVEEVTISSDGVYNTTVTSLWIQHERFSKIGESLAVGEVSVAASVATMIESNTTLVDLIMRDCEFKPEDWIDKIFPALSKNTTLQKLTLFYCRGLKGDTVGQALLHLIQQGISRLDEIDLHMTGMEGWQGKVNEELRINREYRRQLQNQPMVTATSGRIVLCGFEFTGKTTIRNTMEAIEKGRVLCCQPLSIACEGLLRMIPALQQIFAQRDLQNRTRGIDILVLNKLPRTISVWDIAGQQEYYALHKYLFPNAKNSCFLYVSGCVCTQGKMINEENMKNDFFYWMRFIASCSKPGNNTGSVGLPYVQFVLTKKDRLSAQQLKRSTQAAEDLVVEFRKVFANKIQLSRDVEVINALEPLDVEVLLKKTNTKLEKILHAQLEYEVCQAVLSALDDWSRNSSTPILSLEDFKTICTNKVLPKNRGHYRSAKLDTEGGRNAILAYLNDTGVVIYSYKLEFIVANPRWFGIGILGSLTDPIGGGTKLRHVNGFVKKESLKELLEVSLKKTQVGEDVTVNLLIELMKELEMCFEADTGGPDSYLFLPILFDDAMDMAAKGERQLDGWKEKGEVYIGRRLECLDKTTTILTPGFFPRLQVHLLNYIRDKGWMCHADEFFQVGIYKANHGLKVDRNLIRFAFNGQDICIEYSEVDFFVDIMVKSAQPFQKTLDFIKTELIFVIDSFCRSPQGCQGVDLVQAVIQRLCVQNLDACKARRPQSVPISHLKGMIERYGDDFMYKWPNDCSSERARDLLEGPPESSSSSSSSSTSTSYKQEDNNTSSGKDKLPDFRLSIVESQLLEELKASLSGLKLFHLHLYCDGLDNSRSQHHVHQQPGRILKLRAKAGHYDYESLKRVVQVFAKTTVGTTVGELVNWFFKEADLNIDYERLEKFHEPNRDWSPEEAGKALEKFLVYTERLEKILDVKNEKFAEDFELEKVKFEDGTYHWLCPEHLTKAVQQGRVFKLER